MLKLYRTPDCPKYREIQEALDEMSLAHEVVVVKNRGEVQEDLAGKRLPLLIDNDEISEGSDAILRHLEELKGFKELWDKFQGDYCYCDDDGGIE